MKPKHILKITLFFVSVIVFKGCYEDEGNYTYNTLPPNIDIKFEKLTYSKGLSIDSLNIEPIITYDGDESDLSYEWQYLIPAIEEEEFGVFKTFTTGKNLSYKVGIDEVVTGTGTYNLRLAVANKKLANSEKDPEANMTFSDIIILDVGDSRNYLGLMVLHSNNGVSDVGLIEDDLFAENLNIEVPSEVTSEYYSLYNSGEKIEGIGKRISQFGRINSYAPPLPYGPGPGVSYIFVFTDKVGLTTDHFSMKKIADDYSSILLNPSLATGIIDAWEDKTTSQAIKSFVDDGRIFYGNMYGPMQADFTYKAAPFITLPYSYVSNVGVVGFDELSTSFLYSNRDAGKMVIYKMPPSSNAGISFDPNNTNANLEYLETRSIFMATMAVMTDKVTGNKFLVEMNFNMMPMLDMVTQGKYDMSALPDIENINHYAFGGGNNLNYLASSNTLYHYLYKTTNSSTKIYDFPEDESITMMKFVREEPDFGGPNFDYIYYNSNRVFTVATVDASGQGKLYVFNVDLITGQLDLYKTYDGTESGGNTFGTIHDVDLKIKGVFP